MDERCLLTTHTIKCELEMLAGLVGRSTTLLQAYDIANDDVLFRWIVSDSCHILLPRVRSEDLRLSLDNFSAKYCAPAVKTMREGMNV